MKPKKVLRAVILALDGMRSKDMQENTRLQEVIGILVNNYFVYFTDSDNPILCVSDKTEEL